MKDGFIRVAAATPEIRVADCESDKTEIVWQSSELKLHKK